jgi:hypothetical protein
LTNGRKIAPIWILLSMFVAAPIFLMVSCLTYLAFEARRPRQMPLSSIWIDAPAVPFGFYHGWWEDCWMETDQQANHCQLYRPGLHPPVVYEGRYVSCDGKGPIPLNELKLRAPAQAEEMWIFQRFVVFLNDGRLLVPVENIQDCAKIRQRTERTGVRQ